MNTMINEQYQYSELTGKVIGCAMEVHRHLGNGFQEVIYQRALSIELHMQGIAHIREQEIPLQYKDHDIGTRRADFFIEDKIMLEIKAVKELETFLRKVNWMKKAMCKICTLVVQTNR